MSHSFTTHYRYPAETNSLSGRLEVDGLIVCKKRVKKTVNEI